MSARYTLIIGSKNTSSWSLRPWLAMKMAGIGFEEVLVGLRRPETKTEILAHSPSGKVPALIIEEAGSTQTVWDSLAICETLAERHPAAHLWPADSATRASARAVTAEMHSGFPDVRKQLSMEIAARHPTPSLDAEAKGQIARIVSIWEESLARYGKDGGFLFGGFTIADAFYAPVVTRFETYGIALPPAARAYAARILALSPMREWESAAKAEAAARI